MNAVAMNAPDLNNPAPSDPLRAGGVLDWERTYATFTHLTLILTHIIPVPVVPALAMWLIKRDQSAFVNDHGKEAVNFHLSLLIYVLVGGILTAACGVGLLLIVGAYVLGIYGLIAGAVAAGHGRYYRYPMCLRLIS